MIICPNCKSECEENTAFCGNCGWKLDQAPPAAAEMGSEAQAEQLPAVVVRQVKGFGKKEAILAAAVIILAVLSWFGYQKYTYWNSPEYVVDSFMREFAKGTFPYQYINVQESEFINEKAAKDMWEERYGDARVESYEISGELGDIIEEEDYDIVDVYLDYVEDATEFLISDKGMKNYKKLYTEKYGKQDKEYWEDWEEEEVDFYEEELDDQCKELKEDLKEEFQNKRGIIKKLEDRKKERGIDKIYLVAAMLEKDGLYQPELLLLGLLKKSNKKHYIFDNWKMASDVTLGIEWGGYTVRHISVPIIN